MSQINKSSDYFSTNLWVADDSSPRSFTGFGHQPDFVWVKHRGSASINHTLADSVRGGDKMLASNTTAVEDTKSHGEITSFDSDGITVADGTNATYPRLYFNDLDPFGSGGGNYVGWSWKAGGTASSNTDGSITSTVSANTTSGFSIVSYTGDGSGISSVGHGLNATPKLIIGKNRDSSDATFGRWLVGGSAISSFNFANDYMVLNSTGAKATDASGTVWNSAPTSTVVNFANFFNTNTNKYIMYCFAEKKGFSKFGSYTGNGSATDGTFVYTGFKPAFIIIKGATNPSSWLIQDNKRQTYNDGSIPWIKANTSDAEFNLDNLDMLSNGFKCRTSNNDFNGANTYIYMAFAENPLVGTNNIPTTAR